MFASILFSWDTRSIGDSENSDAVKLDRLVRDVTREREEFGKNLYVYFDISNEAARKGVFRVIIKGNNKKDIIRMIKRTLHVISHSTVPMWEELDDSIEKAWEDISYIEDRTVIQFRKAYENDENGKFRISIMFECSEEMNR